MKSPELQAITTLLQEVNQGHEGAMDKLMAAVYEELRAGAERLMRREVSPGRPGATLQPTALVHDAFLKLIKERQKYDKRGHFFVAFTTCMKEVLLDYIRKQKAAKRGGDWARVPLDPDQPATVQGADLSALLEALEKLDQTDARNAEVAQLRLLCGLTNKETAQSLGVSLATVERDWRFCRAWLKNEIDGAEP